MRTITTQIPDDLAAHLDEIASHEGRSKSWLIREALKDYLEQQREFQRLTQEGLDAARAGKLVEHEKVSSELDQWGD